MNWQMPFSRPKNLALLRLVSSWAVGAAAGYFAGQPLVSGVVAFALVTIVLRGAVREQVYQLAAGGLRANSETNTYLSKRNFARLIGAFQIALGVGILVSTLAWPRSAQSPNVMSAFGGIAVALGLNCFTVLIPDLIRTGDL